MTLSGMVMDAVEEERGDKMGYGEREQMRAKSLGIGFCFVWMQRMDARLPSST
jgi:hypothetical protein